MVIMTMIARVADGLPLTASIQEDEEVSYCSIIIIINYNTVCNCNYIYELKTF